jgi:hypothetical protein
LTILHDAQGFQGGYIVTNLWGRPVEFRLTTSVSPTKLQQILYAGTLTEYVCGELIGKALYEKCATAAQLVLTDHPAALALRLKVDVPVVLIAGKTDDRALAGLADGSLLRPHPARPSVLLASRHGGDREPVNGWLDRLDANWDLAEPFTRLREALGEARKLGVLNRAS